MKSIFDIHDLQKELIKKGFALQLQASTLIFCDSRLQDNS